MLIPLESDAVPLWAELIPEDAEVDREPTVLFVVERPEEADVESEDTPLAAALIPLDAEVDRDPT